MHVTGGGSRRADLSRKASRCASQEDNLSINVMNEVIGRVGWIKCYDFNCPAGSEWMVI